MIFLLVFKIRLSNIKDYVKLITVKYKKNKLIQKNELKVLIKINKS